jgi:hypothetical protein
MEGPGDGCCVAFVGSSNEAVQPLEVSRMAKMKVEPLKKRFM